MKTVKLELKGKIKPVTLSVEEALKVVKTIEKQLYIEPPRKCNCKIKGEMV